MIKGAVNKRGQVELASLGCSPAKNVKNGVRFTYNRLNRSEAVCVQA
jgi:hypothetical protein